MGTRDVDTKGARLGRYVIDEWLASGGMADVYRARAHGAAGIVKELAIKRVAATSLSSRRALERFVAEARLSMQLSHANIISVFDFGRAEDGYYLAMEWIDGIDLASLIGHADAPSPLPLAVVAYVGGEVARALQHAHEQSSGAIVHRDVKPSNVLVSRAGDVKLGDFGIAITVGDRRTVAGTRGYMAPEQARGDAVDERADLYGLGKVLLEIAVGQRIDDPDIPYFLREIEPELAQIVGSLLAPEREARASSAKVVASLLERLSSHAIARGDESPRDVLVGLVEQACVARAPSAARASGLGRMESFALTDTAPAAGFGSAAVTRPDGPKRADAPQDDAPEASSIAPPAQVSWRWPVSVAILVSMMIGLALVRRFTAPRREAPVVATAPSERTQAPVVVRAPAPSPVVIDAGALDATIAAAPTDDDPRPAPRTRSEPAERPTPGSSTVTLPVAAPSVRTTGILNVAARPWARVFVDDHDEGVSPVLGLSVSAGRHQVRLVNDALGVTRSVSVEVPADGRRNVTVDLEQP